MPATVGATLTGASFPLRHAGLGPYQSTAGNTYWFGRDGATNVGNARCWKASDPMTALTAQAAKLMSSGATTAIEAMGCYQNGNVIHVATQLATGVVYYNAYTMDTDTWSLTTSETPQSAAATTFAPTAGITLVSLVVRSNGNVVFAYAGGVTAMSGTLNTCYYRERTGVNTYGTATKFDNAGSINWLGPMALLGASDRVHFLLNDATGGNVYQRTLSSANALQTFPAAISTTLTGVPIRDGVGSASGSSVVAPYQNNSGDMYAARWTSADAPTVSTAGPIQGPGGGTNRSQKSTQNHVVYRLVHDSATVHSLYIGGSDSDLYHNSSTDTGATWTESADTNELAATLNNETANVYTRSGTKYLAMVLDDAGTIRYAEITLAAAPAAQKPRMYRQPATVLYY